MRSLVTIGFVATLAIATLSTVSYAQGDARRGAEAYRRCAGCHSLQPDQHLTGPSLANLWGKKAGTVTGFARYSKELKSTDIVWDEDTLNAWLSDPQTMAPGTYMVFRGLDNDAARADLIAFLEMAMAPDGARNVVARGLAPEGVVEGQVPDPLSSAPPELQVTDVRHCGDSYFVATADGRETPYWEMNVRLKLDTRVTGPDPSNPVNVVAGMAGDRVSIVFSQLEELSRLVAEKC